MTSVRLRVENVWTYLEGQFNSSVKAEVDFKLSYKLPDAEFAIRGWEAKKRKELIAKYGKEKGSIMDLPWRWDGRFRFFEGKNHRFPTGFFGDVRKIMLSQGQEFSVVDLRGISNPSLKLKLVDFTPYPDQEIIKNQAIANQRGVIQQPTGSGKAEIIAMILAELNRPAIVLIHRESIFRQLISRLSHRLGTKVGIVGAGENIRRPITVAMTQTVQAKKFIPWLQTFPVVISDECFPKGSFVDNNAIEKIKKGDRVLSFNHETLRLEKKTVLKTMNREYKGDWYRITDESGHRIICTEGHPIFVPGYGYVPVSYLPKRDACDILLKYEMPKLRERTSNKESETSISKAQILQSGLFSGISKKNKNGGKTTRENASFKKMEVFGSSENQRFKRSRLASIEIYKRGSGSRPTWVPKKDTVYNLHIEGNENYFVDNILVHNCHHVPADTIYEVMQSLNQAYYRYGFSATPWREDGKEMFLKAAFGGFICQKSPTDLIYAGRLTVPHVFFLDTQHDHTADSLSWQSQYTKTIVNGHHRNRMVVSAAYMFWKMKKTCLIAVTQIKHGEMLLKMLKQSYPGIKVTFIQGEDESEQKQITLKKLDERKLDVVIATSVFGEGIDVPSLDAIINAKGQDSKTDVFQLLGRAIRKTENKKRAYFVDFYDCQYYTKPHAMNRFNILKAERAYRVKKIKDVEELAQCAAEIESNDNDQPL